MGKRNQRRVRGWRKWRRAGKPEGRATKRPAEEQANTLLELPRAWRVTEEIQDSMVALWGQDGERIGKLRGQVRSRLFKALKAPLRAFALCNLSPGVGRKEPTAACVELLW